MNAMLANAVTNLKHLYRKPYFILWKRLNAGTVPANKDYAAGTLSNVRRCWMAVLACRTIEKKYESLICTPRTHAPAYKPLCLQ